MVVAAQLYLRAPGMASTSPSGVTRLPATARKSGSAPARPLNSLAQLARSAPFQYKLPHARPVTRPWRSSLTFSTRQ